MTRWEGALTIQEAETVVWIPLDALDPLNLDVDKIAVQEYLRVYAS